MAYTPLTGRSTNNYEHVENFAGLPVSNYDSTVPLTGNDKAWRIATDPWDDELPPVEESFAAFFADPKVGEVTAVVIGPWGEGDESPDEVIKALSEGADKLPNLRAIFLGDIVQEENEMSWIEQDNVSPLLNAYPNLEILHIRGVGVSFEAGIRHNSLKHLVQETIEEYDNGGIYRCIANASFPQLEYLEVWHAEQQSPYADEPNGMGELLGQDALPNLKHLGLRNSKSIDKAIADTVVSSPLLAHLEALDFSGGTFGDDGANALLEAHAAGKLANITTIEVSNHYMSDEVQAKFTGLGIEITGVDNKGEEEDWGDGEMYRYIMVSE